MLGLQTFLAHGWINFAFVLVKKYLLVLFYMEFQVTMTVDFKHPGLSVIQNTMSEVEVCMTVSNLTSPELSKRYRWS
jgi:hypothetical protein